MKHSAKAAARLARERAKLERRSAARAGKAGHAAGTAQASAGAETVSAAPGPADRAARPRLAQLPYAMILAGVVAGLALMQITKGAVRSGTLVIAGALLAGSLTRLVLPDGRAGLLRSRRRLVDVAFLTALGAGLLVAGLIVKLPG